MTAVALPPSRPRPPAVALPPARPRPPAVRLPRLLAGIYDEGPVGIYGHELQYGPMPVRGRSRSRARLVDVVEASGLTGRGGAGFPAGRKMRSVLAGPGSKVAVANGAEGEPASLKDRLL
ncbi:MAG TPA: hypothetical protein VJ371_10840, partial [Streptosporangiaceae bacterium]|nr:hypothetical protein [Streptosporangiaceae bacterium]